MAYIQPIEDLVGSALGRISGLTALTWPSRVGAADIFGLYYFTALEWPSRLSTCSSAAHLNTITQVLFGKRELYHSTYLLWTLRQLPTSFREETRGPYVLNALNSHPAAPACLGPAGHFTRPLLPRCVSCLLLL